jgi:hypothetical protein
MAASAAGDDLMHSEDDLRTGLRQQLRVALRDRDRIAVAALRQAIAALDNAEAIPPDSDLMVQSSEYVAGAAVGLGAAEAERRILDADAQRAIVKAEIDTRLAAATAYEEHGQSARGAELRLGAEVLLAALGAIDGER